MGRKRMQEEKWRKKETSNLEPAYAPAATVRSWQTDGRTSQMQRKGNCSFVLFPPSSSSLGSNETLTSPILKIDWTAIKMQPISDRHLRFIQATTLTRSFLHSRAPSQCCTCRGLLVYVVNASTGTVPSGHLIMAFHDVYDTVITF
ncbi:hypothetical protein HOY80DRAFT_999508 [Tuber brumale]|nr:hypothetical protein HOY80DRAFT_999508 [Tuber brumale]